MPRVLYLRAELLPRSETFIAAQAGALSRYTAGFAGLKQLHDTAWLGAPVIAQLEDGGWWGRAARWAYLKGGERGQGERGWDEHKPALRDLFAGVSHAALQRYAHKIAAWDPDLLHAHFATDAAAFLPILTRCERLLERQLPLVVTLHGYDVGLTDEAHAQTRLGRIFLSRRAALWQRAMAFLCVSEELRHRAIERGFPPEKLLVHYTGVAVLPRSLSDLDLAQPDLAQPDRPRLDSANADSTQLERSATEVLFVGRLVEKKGCDTLLDAVALLVQHGHGPKLCLTLIGDGPWRSRLEEQARQLGLFDSLAGLDFMGAQSPQVVAIAMRRATVLAVPSRRAANGDCEGLPTVILEAMAAGLPVVASDGSGAEEALIDGRTGWLVEPGSAQALAAGLGLALGLRLELGHSLASDFGLGPASVSGQAFGPAPGIDSPLAFVSATELTIGQGSAPASTFVSERPAASGQKAVWAEVSAAAEQVVRERFDLAKQTQQLERYYDQWCESAP